MAGKKIGYIRVSSFDQNPERQLEGIELDKKFIDKAQAEIQTGQLYLSYLIMHVRMDIIIVHSMDRSARNLDDLRQIVQKYHADANAQFD